MNHRYIFYGILGVIIYMFPYFILGEDAYLTIHDFLDQNVAIMADLKNNGLLRSYSGMVPNMCGLDRSLFPLYTPFDVKMVSYDLLPTYWAVISFTLCYKILAFIGMYLLLDSYIFCKANKIISVLLSLGFALVPFYADLYLSGAGFPLVAYAFLNLLSNRHLMWSYLAVLFYCFNSLLAYGGFFVLVILICFVIYNYYRYRIVSFHVLCGLMMMCSIYVILNWGTFYSLFFSDTFISHRSVWINMKPLTVDIKEFIRIIVLSHYHAGSMLAIPIVFLFFVIYFFYGKKYSIFQYSALLYCTLVAGVLVGVVLKHSDIQLFTSVKFDRFYFLYPSIVFIMAAVVCYSMIKEGKKNIAIAIASYGLVCGLVFDKEIRNNIKLLIGQEISLPTFRQFYDVALFAKIHSDLKSNYQYSTKTVSLGIFPSVAEYNCFYTLDSYRVNYPLAYKNEFRQVIEKELEKNDTIRITFDEWGSRCYLYSAELGMKNLYGKSENCHVERLEINTTILKELGCEYILSAVEVLNYKELGLNLVKSYTTPESFWSIWVYKLS